MMKFDINYSAVKVLEAFVQDNETTCRKIMFGLMWDEPSDMMPHWTEQSIGDALNSRISVDNETNTAATLFAMLAEVLADDEYYSSPEVREVKEQWIEKIVACFR